MFDEITVIEQPLQHVLAIRQKTNCENLSELIQKSYDDIITYMTSIGVQPSGVPYISFSLECDMNDFELETGFPVAEAHDGSGSVIAAEIPESKAVVLMYKGPYQGLEHEYPKLMRWIVDNQAAPSGKYYEFYLNSPHEVPEAELITRMQIPLK